MAWLIPIAVSVIGGAIQSHQASKAANAQKQAAQQGSTEAGAVYNQQQRVMSPYYTAGTGALGQMTGLQGLPAPMTNLPASAAYTPGAGPSTLPPAAPETAVARGGGRGVPGISFAGGGAQPMSMASLSQSSYGAPSSGGGSFTRRGGQTVRLVSPDGTETQDVPAEHADFFVQQGARRIT